MPKLKTSRSAAKRFSTTGSGKFRRRRQALRHILTKKDAKRRMRLGQSTLVDSANLKSVRRLLPYAYFPPETHPDFPHGNRTGNGAGVVTMFLPSERRRHIRLA